jgi:hypothetical protein
MLTINLDRTMSSAVVGSRNVFKRTSMRFGAALLSVLAEMILTFFTGISMEQHLNVGKAAINRKVNDFMKVVRQW